jgi:hypothetical protein
MSKSEMGMPEDLGAGDSDADCIASCVADIIIISTAETAPKWVGVEPLPMAAHRFKVGQLVTLHSKRHGVWAEPGEVSRLLPYENGDFRYRVNTGVV